MGFASISTDLYLPAMPAMGRALRADGRTVEWTVRGISSASVWASFSGAQSATVMAAGFGGNRTRAIRSRLAGCALAGSIWALIGRRVLQAVGACAGVALVRAVIGVSGGGPYAAITAWARKKRVASTALSAGLVRFEKARKWGRFLAGNGIFPG